MRDELLVVYRLATAAGVTISQPQQQPAALQGSNLYVEVDRLDSYTHILPELTRLFTDDSKDPDLAQFLIALTLTMVSTYCSVCIAQRVKMQVLRTASVSILQFQSRCFQAPRAV